MGATARAIRAIFFLEGLLVGGIGVAMGMLFALVFGLAQEHFGFLTLQGGENFRINAFPVEMRLSDFLLIFATVMSLSLIAAIYPAIKASQVQVVEGMRK